MCFHSETSVFKFLPRIVELFEATVVNNKLQNTRSSNKRTVNKFSQMLLIAQRSLFVNVRRGLEKRSNQPILHLKD